jgi:hypothetical protein
VAERVAIRYEVKRVKGNKILWIALITVLFSSLLTSAGLVSAAPQAKIFLDPARIPDKGEGAPGDEYDMALKIDNVVNAWAVQIKVSYRPYVSVLVASNFWEGDFMSEDGTWPTAFYATTNAFEGTVTFVIFRLGSYGSPGASGSGTLATFKLKVVEAGEGPIDIVETILIAPPEYPGDVNPIPHTTDGSYYHGPYARLLRVNMPDGRKVTAGDTFSISTKVKNEGEIPLNVTVAVRVQRAEDGRTNLLHPGQTYVGGGLGEPRPFEYLYLDEFNEWYYEWVGDATNALGTPDGSYIEGDTNAQWASLYGFEDIALAGRSVAEITCEVYSQYPNGATDNVDIDMYGFSSVQGFAWLGSGYGGSAWGWHGMRWIGDSVFTVMPELASEAEINGLELLIYNYHGDAPDVARVDSVRLKVEFSGIVPVAYLTWELAPGEERVLPDIVWQSDADHIGSYSVTANVEYSSEFFKWNSWGSVEKDLFFWIVE